MMLTTKSADHAAKLLVQDWLDLGWPKSGAHSHYSDVRGHKRPRWAATHVRTEVYYGTLPGPNTSEILWDIEEVLRKLPGAVASGTYPGTEDPQDRYLRRPYAWVLRLIDTPSQPLPKPPVTEEARTATVTPSGRHYWRQQVNTCQQCGRKFGVVRIDARYCSGACRQKAYRERTVTK
jgi:hypothetical protein